MAALREQAERFSHVGFSVLPYESYVSLAERLARLSPGTFFESGDLLRRSEAIGARIEAHVRQWSKNCSLIGEIRRRGAMIGIELVKSRATREPAKHEAEEIIRMACERGLILIAAGTSGNVIRFLTPLTITDGELDEGLGVLSHCFTAACSVLAS